MYQLSGRSQIISKGEVLEVIREGKVVLVEGKPIKADITRFPLRANVQPLKGMEMLLVAEGNRYKETYWLYTNELDKPIIPGDRVLRLGVNFTVQSPVETWGHAPNGYQKAMIIRVDTGPQNDPVKVTG